MPWTRKANTAPARRSDEQGTALVEFALILPLVLMLAFGVVTAGLTYNHKIDLTHAAREGARYGATLAQLDTPLGAYRFSVSTRLAGRAPEPVDPTDPADPGALGAMPIVPPPPTGAPTFPGTPP